jgi:hypothetical protein
LPSPKPGRGFFDSRVTVRLRRLAPTVMSRWLRAVCIRLSAVGCLLRAPISSGTVENRDRVISSRTMEMRDTLDELELAVSPVADRDSGTFDSSSGPPGGLPVELCLLSLSASSSASSILRSSESMANPEIRSENDCVQLYYVKSKTAQK